MRAMQLLNKLPCPMSAKSNSATIGTTPSLCTHSLDFVQRPHQAILVHDSLQPSRWSPWLLPERSSLSFACTPGLHQQRAEPCDGRSIAAYMHYHQSVQPIISVYNLSRSPFKLMCAPIYLQLVLLAFVPSPHCRWPRLFELLN